MLDGQRASVTRLYAVLRCESHQMMFKRRPMKTEKRCVLAPKPQPLPADFIGTWTLMPLSAAIRFKHNPKKDHQEVPKEQRTKKKEDGGKI
jgi:hypothetical protein